MELSGGNSTLLNIDARRTQNAALLQQVNQLTTSISQQSLNQIEMLYTQQMSSQEQVQRTAEDFAGDR